MKELRQRFGAVALIAFVIAGFRRRRVRRGVHRRETDHLSEFRPMLSFFLAQTTDPQNEDIFQGVRDFFDSQIWDVIKNVAIFFLVAFWLATAYWVYKDARRRIEDPWLIAIAVALGVFPPFFGPIIYLCSSGRPNTSTTYGSASSRSRRWRTRLVARSAARSAAPSSTRAISHARSARRKLKDSCRRCHQSLEPLWQICPYCETPVDTPRAVESGSG